jgi:hypothetical protein
VIDCQRRDRERTRQFWRGRLNSKEGRLNGKKRKEIANVSAFPRKPTNF